MEQIFENVKEIEKRISCFLSPDENFAETLMIENAATALEKHVNKICSKNHKHSTDKKKNTITILCGSGNNGADGYTLARHIAEKYDIVIIKTAEPKSIFCKSAFENLRPLTESAVKIFDYCTDLADANENSSDSDATSKTQAASPNPADATLKTILDSSDVIVDCIFGTGFHGLIDDTLAPLFTAVNATRTPKIACDIPSGLDTTGTPLAQLSDEERKSRVIYADKTISMGAHKTALFSDIAKDITGKLHCEPIGVSKPLFDKIADSAASSPAASASAAASETSAASSSASAPSASEPQTRIFLLSKNDIKYPNRTKLNSHKGIYGHTCVISGSKPGAAILSATAALHCGSGLSSLYFTDPAFNEKFKIPASIMTTNAIPQNTTCLITGPGFGRAEDNEYKKEILNSLLTVAKKRCIPLVLDADCFYYDETIQFLEQNCTDRGNTDNRSKKTKVILTPHPKEFAELLNRAGLANKNKVITAQDVQNNRLELVKQFSKKYPGAVLVLKGANTFITAGGNIYICTLGSAALSKGGSGDVLAGAIGGLLAQGYSAKSAAISGTLMHALASGKFKKNYSLTPEELIKEL
ncbi:NAD(P)H-hydrate dehydratase [Treponema sp.]|uniref:NAD(P)H-hydrate dehydratase n=1 Tax=Treponema sp. TaxID=166 RepID=UPI00298D83FB|nr:NAD(P)H-hydrate dehydratase [Treponema sp.]MCR5614314.1 NAD(P)H-hydrate dehydratase [Treponema sp.]